MPLTPTCPVFSALHADLSAHTQDRHGFGAVLSQTRSPTLGHTRGIAAGALPSRNENHQPLNQLQKLSRWDAWADQRRSIHCVTICKPRRVSNARTVIPMAKINCDRATVTPTAAANKSEAAVVSPCTSWLDRLRMMVPAPRKLTPVITAPMMRKGSVCIMVWPGSASKFRTMISPSATSKADAPDTNTCVRNPAGLWAISRSIPSAAPNSIARATYAKISS